LKDLAYLLCSDDEADSESRITAQVGWEGPQKMWNEVWGWNAISCCIITKPKEQCISLGDDGHINLLGSGEDLNEQIPKPDDRSGDLREVRAIDGIPYVVGINRQCFRRPKAGVWERFDQGLPPKGDLPGLESIHGFNANELYAVGWKGEIWERSKRTKGKWKLAAQPTTLAFFRVLCAEDGNVYAAGQGGIIFRGRGATWEVIDHRDMKDDIFDLEWFAGKLWLSTMYSLHTLENGHLSLVDFDGEPPSTCNHLSTADGLLWSIGAKDVMQFDGKDWTRIL
jgi:hypothetical protein